MRIITDVGVPVTMRDGTRLVADIHRPDVPEPVPALLMRTPYGRSLALGSPFHEGLRLVREGFAMVVQDVRGRGGSDGEFYPLRTEADDGTDTIDWVVAQPWCSGSIGTIGASYLGATQWLLAGANPAALKAIAPIVTAANYHDGWTYRGGAFELGFNLQWTLSLCLDLAERAERQGSDPAGLVDRVRDALDRIDALYLGLDADAEDLIRRLAPFYFDWRDHPTEDGGWAAIAPKVDAGSTLAPALNVGGWYDIFLEGTLTNFANQRRSARQAGRRGPRLVVGPWGHGVYAGRFPGRRFGSRAAIDVAGIVDEQVRWFDEHLRSGPGAGERAPVRLFVLGLDEWRDFDDWPASSASATTLYPIPGAAGGGPADAGGLSLHEPDGECRPIQVSFDPADPVPTLGGATLFAGSTIGERAGPADLTPLQSRPDVMTFTSEPFERDRLILGPVVWHVPAEATTAGFDLVGNVADVAPSGRSELLTGGVLRVADGRRGEARRVELGSTAALIKAGHRIRLFVSASDYPRFDLNPVASAAGGASISLLSTAAQRSRLVLMLGDLPDS